MEQKIINFCKEFENNLARTFNSNINDIDYFNYCLGQKDTSLNVRKMVRENEEKDYVNKLEKMQEELRAKEEKEEDRLQSQFYIGGINFISYVLREMER